MPGTAGPTTAFSQQGPQTSLSQNTGTEVFNAKILKQSLLKYSVLKPNNGHLNLQKITGHRIFSVMYFSVLIYGGAFGAWLVIE